jgi:hypothetical protein
VLPFSWVVAIVSDVGEALLHLLRHRVLHLDISLRNVMVAPLEGKPSLPRAVVVDFGCAQQMADDSLRVLLRCHTRDNVGNAAHAAPEVHLALQQLRLRDAQLDLSKQVRLGGVGEGGGA